MIHNIQIKVNSRNPQPNFTKDQIVNLMHKFNHHNIPIKFTEISRINGLPTFEIDSYNISNNYSLVSHELVVNGIRYNIEDIQLISNQIVNENKDKIVDFILNQLNIPINTLNEEDSHKAIIRQLKLESLTR